MRYIKSKSVFSKYASAVKWPIVYSIRVLNVRNTNFMWLKTFDQTICEFTDTIYGNGNLDYIYFLELYVRMKI